MTITLTVVAVLMVIVLATRRAITRRVEDADGHRPRDAQGVVRGASGFTLERAGAPGVLLIHGAGDTPQTLRELGEHLYQLGFAISAPLLPGHGRRVRDFRHVTSDGWRAAVERAYDELAVGRSWVGVVGLSMGGALAVRAVADRPMTAALVLLAPYLGLPMSLRLAAGISRLAALVSPYFSAEDTRSVRDPDAAAQGLAYGVFTPAALRALRDTARAGARALPRVHAPTLIIQSQQDNRVAPEVAVRALKRIGASDKRLEWVSDGGHVITVDYGKRAVFALTGDWLISHGADALLRP